MYSYIVLLIAAVNAIAANPWPARVGPQVVRIIAIPPEALRDYKPEESHPFESAIRVEQPTAAAPMEVSDDDEYEETAPTPRVIARPLRPAPEPHVFRLADNFDGDNDMSASKHHKDLQPAASGYGGGHGPSGWLDMGAYSSGYGAFGWYADYPVGGGKGYGRR